VLLLLFLKQRLSLALAEALWRDYSGERLCIKADRLPNGSFALAAGSPGAAQGQLVWVKAILGAPPPSNWPRSPSPARWCAPSSPRSAACAHHRYARDHEPAPNCTKAAGQVCRRAERRGRWARGAEASRLDLPRSNSLRDRFLLELVSVVACTHHGLLASKLGKKASTKHRPIQ
jgi:hypothetical protein